MNLYAVYTEYPYLHFFYQLELVDVCFDLLINNPSRNCYSHCSPLCVFITIIFVIMCTLFSSKDNKKF